MASQELNSPGLNHTGDIVLLLEVNVIIYFLKNISKEINGGLVLIVGEEGLARVMGRQISPPLLSPVSVSFFSNFIILDLNGDFFSGGCVVFSSV